MKMFHNVRSHLKGIGNRKEGPGLIGAGAISERDTIGWAALCVERGPARGAKRIASHWRDGFAGTRGAPAVGDVMRKRVETIRADKRRPNQVQPIELIDALHHRSGVIWIRGFLDDVRSIDGVTEKDRGARESVFGGKRSEERR